VKLCGELNFESVADLLNDSQLSFEHGDVEVDLSGISRFNSASLALLIEWVKMAQQKGMQVSYHRASEQLAVIAQAYGIDRELPLK